MQFEYTQYIFLKTLILIDCNVSARTVKEVDEGSIWRSNAQEEEEEELSDVFRRPSGSLRNDSRLAREIQASNSM